MINEILTKYKIKFNIIRTTESKEIQILSSVLPQISGYLLKCYPEFLTEEVMPEIDKALNGLSYDTDGGGIMSTLSIGIPSSTLEDIYNPANVSSVPTIDLKEILESYLEWISLNNLEDFI